MMINIMLDDAINADCKHKRTEIIAFEDERFAVCLECHRAKIANAWHNVPIATARLFAANEVDSANKLIRFMDECREERNFPYPSLSVEYYQSMGQGLKRQAELMKELAGE